MSGFMLIVSMSRMLGGGTAGVCASAAREPASARDNPATEQIHFFISAHLLGGARRKFAEEERIVTCEYRSHPGTLRSERVSGVRAHSMCQYSAQDPRVA